MIVFEETATEVRDFGLRYFMFLDFTHFVLDKNWNILSSRDVKF